MDRSGSLKRWELWAGHIGYAAEGIVYLLLGGVVLLADVQRRRQPNGSQGALAELGHTSLGKALLALLALGLAAFVLWQMVLALIDPEHRRDRATVGRYLVRARHFFSGLFYSFLVGEAIWTALGLHMAGERSRTRWGSWLLQWPPGRVAIGMVGAGIMIFACNQFYRAVTHDKSKRVDLSHSHLRGILTVLGTYGYLCRSVLFGLVGLYVVDAAWRFDPHYTNGIGVALGTMQGWPYGLWLLGVIAAGLICYGLFQILKERYRLFRNS